MSDEQARISLALITGRNFKVSQENYRQRSVAFCFTVWPRISPSGNCVAVMSQGLRIETFITF